MTMDETATRSRRALLAAAAGAAGVIAANAALPGTVRAADPDDVVKGADNPTTATTSVTNSGDDSTALAGHATGIGYGYGVEGTSAGGAGVFGWSVSAPDWEPPFDAAYTAVTGVFGFAPAGDGENTYGSGVWGDSPDTGVYGSGSIGVEGNGGYGVAGFTNGLPGGIGVLASSPSNAAVALHAEGKVHFSRSGRKKVAKGKASVAVTLAGVTTGSKVFALFATNESGRWVRAVVPASGRFTVYFNTRVTSAAYLSWFVLD